MINALCEIDTQVLDGCCKISGASLRATPPPLTPPAAVFQNFPTDFFLENVFGEARPAVFEFGFVWIDDRHIQVVDDCVVGIRCSTRIRPTSSKQFQ